MAYLCVNPDGTELICSVEPIRWCDLRVQTTDKIMSFHDRRTGERYYIREAYGVHEFALYPHAADYWRAEEIIDMSEHVDMSIELPSGSIHRLIGRTLTWEDEPVELNALNDRQICD